MKYYVQFLKAEKKFHFKHGWTVTGEVVDAVGVDGVLQLDGRNRLEDIILIARERQEQENRFLKDSKFIGFKIIKGDLKGGSVLFREAWRFA